MRLHQGMGDGEVLYGVATDDAHNHGVAEGVSIPGRGWVMVRSATLSEEAIIRAMKRGDFYSSSGVALKDVGRSGNTIEIDIDPVDGATYVTEFIGTRMGEEGPGPAGEVLFTTSSLTPQYEMKGDELYVRARITSSTPHPRPYKAGDHEMAWTQPMRPIAPEGTLPDPEDGSTEGETR